MPYSLAQRRAGWVSSVWILIHFLRQTSQSVRSAIGSSSAGSLLLEMSSKERKREGNWHSNSLLRFCVEASHPLLASFSTFLRYFYIFIIHWNRIPKLRGHVASVYIISFLTYYGILRTAHPIALCGIIPWVPKFNFTHARTLRHWLGYPHFPCSTHNTIPFQHTSNAAEGPKKP